MQAPRERMFNVPPVVLWTLVAFVVVHLVTTYGLSQREYTEFLLLFAFIPARYDSTLLPGGALPGGFGADIWTFVTYALIHADWTHLFFNAIWLLAFGVAVARRFGPARFLAFFAVTAAAGAAAHLVTHIGAFTPVIGASAGVSGTMAAAIRFAFQKGGPLAMWRHADEESYRVPAAPLMVALREPQVLAFLAVWFGINALFGIGSLSITGGEESVAWQAHIGGFLAGLICFPLFDPVPAAADAGRSSSWPTQH